MNGNVPGLTEVVSGVEGAKSPTETDPGGGKSVSREVPKRQYRKKPQTKLTITKIARSLLGESNERNPMGINRDLQKPTGCSK